METGLFLGPGLMQASWLQNSLISGTWSFPFFKAWLCIILKSYFVLHFYVCEVEDRFMLAQSIMEMKLEIMIRILVLFAHGLLLHKVCEVIYNMR